MKSHGSDNKPPVTVFHLCDENTPYGNITPTEFAKLAAYGCSWCSADIEWGDEGVEIYEKEDAILCATCANHSDGNTRIHTTNMSNIIG